MDDNIFMETLKPISFEDCLAYDENSRGNLGEQLPVFVYRMLEYSLKEALVSRFGKDVQIELFRNAGHLAGTYFAKHMLNIDQPLDSFISELQNKLQEYKIGVLRIEDINPETGRIILTVPAFQFSAKLSATMTKALFPGFYPTISKSLTLRSKSTAGQPATVYAGSALISMRLHKKTIIRSFLHGR